MEDLLERDSAEWRRIREAGLEKKPLSFDLVPNRTNTSDARFAIFRARIPGGWLLVLRPNDSLTFVPDPHHAWDGSATE